MSGLSPAVFQRVSTFSSFGSGRKWLGDVNEWASTKVDDIFEKPKRIEDNFRVFRCEILMDFVETDNQTKNTAYFEGSKAAILRSDERCPIFLIYIIEFSNVET
jgi:hypothetical protein